MSRFENITGWADAFTIANTITNGVLAYALAITVFATLFLSTMWYGRSRALTFASFITGLLLLFLNIQGLVAYWVIVVDIALFAVGLFLMINNKPEAGQGG